MHGESFLESAFPNPDSWAAHHRCPRFIGSAQGANYSHNRLTLHTANGSFHSWDSCSEGECSELWAGSPGMRPHFRALTGGLSENEGFACFAEGRAGINPAPAPHTRVVFVGTGFIPAQAAVFGQLPRVFAAAHAVRDDPLDTVPAGVVFACWRAAAFNRLVQVSIRTNHFKIECRFDT
jgi:hypothetical protein